VAIQTERPGGGDDRIAIYRCHSADEARKARAALEAANVPVDLPDQAIDAIYSTNPSAELAVKVALKHSAKAIQVISTALPPPEPASAIAVAEDRLAAAEQTLAPVEAPKEAPKSDKLPPSAVDKEARRAAILALMSTMFPPMGLLAALMGFSVLREIASRPDESFQGKQRAKLALGLGLLIGILGTAGGILLWMKRSGSV
jgi:hypothetical protein